MIFLKIKGVGEGTGEMVHPHGTKQPSITLVPGYTTPASGLQGHQGYMYYIHIYIYITCGQNTHKHMIK